MFRDLLPDDVAVSWRRAPVDSPRSVPETTTLGTVSPKRLSDFATGRACAHDALRMLGATEPTVSRGTTGAPVWPGGFVGSITHCTGAFGAAAASSDRYRSVGIDAEPLHDLSPDMLRLLQSPEELDRGRAGGVRHADLINFSAKESLYKAWHPLTGSWLDFLEATVEVAPDGTFTATVRHQLAARTGLKRLTGTWAVHDGVVYTALAVAARAVPPATR
ncbi:4'-phosphopantetheinyl transferase [Promicromonospora sukumoe]|uniref:4'-phosphopantetheinyl transferase EntD n=1 Tax=Promicromonospora sukumoe TaxID=88382 RepID=A0A7W3J7T4_9MICO|nr:4'-phosphopantetheinyl transferase superfamily protein [Promicromonospora sukumoe]MBA8807815.1 4'-phosphopantetheinyl transferase EntD [Promicromonospora sukumoe]